MNKTWLITKREYVTRVRNKTFLLSTFLLPLIFILFIGGFVLISIKGKTSNTIALVDANGWFRDYLKSDSSIRFLSGPGIDTLNYEKQGCSGVLIIPALKTGDTILYRLKYKKQIGFEGEADLQARVSNALADRMLYQQTSITTAHLDSIRKAANVLEFRSYEDNGSSTGKASNQGLFSAIGYISGFLIYLLTFIYGAAVMRGVMEEKTNRIAEVIVSSVRPFQLMMGKIIGIGAVGLTQFLLWIILLTGLLFVARGFISHDVLKEVETLQQANATGAPSAAHASAAAQQLYKITGAFSVSYILLILGCFLFYFIGGYLFYSSLFAAVGSAVNEDPQEAQSLMLPITMPVIFSFVIMSIAVRDPAGPLAVWASIIPFSSPIVMMGRIPFGVPGTVPWWQLGTSMLCLIGGFLFTVWLAGKIYRTGILLYGKKVTWRTMWKWAFRS